MFINYIYVFTALIIAVLFLGIILLLKRSKKKVSVIDIILVWPMLLRSKSSPGEDKFVIFGILTMLILIGLSFLINK